MQHAVDAEADDEPGFLRLDVDVRGAHPHRILEHGLQQLDDRRVFHRGAQPQRGEIDAAVADLLSQLLGQAADLLGAPVDAVDGLQQHTLGDHRELDVALQETGNLVVGEQVGRIGHRHLVVRPAVLQDDGAEAARLRLRQAHGDLGLEAEVLEIHERNLELARQGSGDLVFGHEAFLHEYAAELAPALALLVEGLLELLVRQQALLQ